MRSEAYARQPLHDVLTWKPTEMRRQGHGQTVSYIDVVHANLSSLGVDLSCARDRDLWKSVCRKSVAKRRNGLYK